MGQTELSFAVLLIVAYAQAADTTQCCKAKTVGGVSYKLVEAEEDTEKFGCKDACVYEKTVSQGSRFCFKVGALEATCDDIGETDLLSCVIAGQRYNSYLYRVQAENDITKCASRCCSTNVCNYWSFGAEDGQGQKNCYLYSQTYGNSVIKDGFSSGEKGCLASTPMPPDTCLLMNIKIKSAPIDTVPKVTNYVECQKQCEAKKGGCDYWSFGEADEEGKGPGTCLIFSTGNAPETEKNIYYISGPVTCPTTDGICKS